MLFFCQFWLSDWHLPCPRNLGPTTYSMTQLRTALIGGRRAFTHVYFRSAPLSSRVGAPPLAMGKAETVFLLTGSSLTFRSWPIGSASFSETSSERMAGGSTWLGPRVKGLWPTTFVNFPCSEPVNPFEEATSDQRL